MNSEQILDAMIRLARGHPGLLVGIVIDVDEMEEHQLVGISNVIHEDDDWYQGPTPLKDFERRAIQALTGGQEPVESPVSDQAA